MINLSQASEVAYNHFCKKNELKGISDIYATEEYWLFFGRDFPENVVDYGNVPIAIRKDTGEAFYFMLSDLENMKIFKGATTIEVPDKYKIQYH